MRMVVATRSVHKLREIRTILREVADLDLVDLNDVGVPASPEEDEIEIFGTFEENALAKARYFQERTGLVTVADDSGLEVDALRGAPGVHSKRFAPSAAQLSGSERDRENLEHLLGELGDLELADRTARYVCVAALERGDGSGPAIFRGEVEGLILGHARGKGGFGYDPVFYHPASGQTFAEISTVEKDALSHRGEAFRALARHLIDADAG